jgi:hypothetical protein
MLYPQSAINHDGNAEKDKKDTNLYRLICVFFVFFGVPVVVFISSAGVAVLCHRPVVHSGERRVGACPERAAD